MPIAADYHMHTPRCKHAAGPMEAYVERAIELGLREVGFSDHNPLPNGLGAHVRMDENELDLYVADIQRLRERYRRSIEVKLGIELDYVEGLEDFCGKIVERHPWDYIIGSVHYLDRECRIGTWPRNYPGEFGEVYARYFDLLRRLVRSGLCDIVGHFDLPKRSGHPVTELEVQSIRETLEEISRANLCMEINTSGFRHPELLKLEPYPGPDIIEQALAMRTPLTVNSDAHDPSQVGMGFKVVEDLLISKGCRSLAQFERRKLKMYGL